MARIQMIPTMSPTLQAHLSNYMYPCNVSFYKRLIDDPPDTAHVVDVGYNGAHMHFEVTGEEGIKELRERLAIARFALVGHG